MNNGQGWQAQELGVRAMQGFGGAAAHRALCTSSVVAILAGAFALLTPALASAQESDGEIVVTGTRITGFSAPTPVTTLGEGELEQRAVRNLADVMYDIPALKPVQNTGQSSQPVGASNLDLRALGPNRTLLLVDGRRFAATDPTGGVDINVLPVGLISRVEMVTGGASAAYGSDAVSGVVNIFLNHRFEGLKGDVQYGISDWGDMETSGASLTGGRGFMDGRLHIVGSADFYRNNGQLWQDSRDWARGDYAVLTNPAYPGTPGAPRQLTSANARFSQMTYGGVTAINNNAALRNIQFGPGGTVLPFAMGTNIGNTYMTGGDGASLSATSNIGPSIERMSAYGRATFEVSNNLSLYADVLWARADIFSDGTTSTDNGNIVINRANAYLPQQIAAIMDANSLTSFRIGRIGGEEGMFTNDIDNEVQRFAVGAEGAISEGWSWNAYVQHSRNTYYREDGNNRNLDRWAYGIDAVINPATGQPICRALLSNPNPTEAQDPYRDIRDCVPINLFGEGSMSQAALDYIGGTAWMDSEQEQTVYAASVEGRPFSTWAGPVSIAFGAEYREESVRATNDEVSQRSRWKTVNPQAVAGSLDVTEFFIEGVVPLLDGAPLAQLLEVNAAARFTDYSTSGSVETWKLGFNYVPFDDLRFRATLSRDIRAANLNELFSGQNQFINTITNPITNVALSTPQMTGGNPALRPEIGDAFTAGAIYQPSWLPGLRVSFDYYSFEIEDAISSLTGQQIVDGCLVRNQTDLCSAITFSGDVITRVEATLINAAEATTSGFDVEAAYSFSLGGGSVDLRALLTHIEELTISNNGVTTDYAGQVGSTGTLGPAGGAPEWRASLSAGYRTELFSLGAQVRFIDGGVRNVTWVDGVDIDSNKVSSRTYLDLNGSIKVGENVELYGAIDNVFNLEPPLTPNAITAPSYASSAFYDRIGRFYAVGARMRF